MDGTTGILACLADALAALEDWRVAFSWLARGDFNFLSTRLALAGVQEIHVECFMVSQFLPSLLASLLSFSGVLWVQLLVCLFSNTLPKAQLQKNLTPNQKSKQKKTLESQIPILVTCRLGDDDSAEIRDFSSGLHKWAWRMCGIYLCLLRALSSSFQGFSHLLWSGCWKNHPLREKSRNHKAVQSGISTPLLQQSPVLLSASMRLMWNCESWQLVPSSVLWA